MATTAKKRVSARSSKRKGAVDVLQNALKSTGEHLGDIVWVDVSAVDVDRDDLRNQFANVGLPPSLVRPDPEGQSALGFASAKYRERDRDIFLRRTRRRGREVMVVRQTGHKFDTLASLEAVGRTLLVNRRTNNDAELEQVLTEIESTFQHHLSYAGGAEVSSTVVGAMLDWCGGIRLKDQGHVYWVPAAGANDLRALKSVIDNLGDSHVTVVSVHENDENRAALQRAAAQSFEAELRRANEELDGFAKRSAETRASTLERRLAEFSDLREKVELYSDILDKQKGKLLKGLKAASDRCKEMIATME